jgi:nucleoside-diphosphate-sugar epimerase
LISASAKPGGGTTDYAVEIFHKAVKGEDFECFLSAETGLPMMYMEDAVRATIQLMVAPSDLITVRTAYNLSAMSFTPEMLSDCIREFFPSFRIRYKPDFRQKIADSWPSSIDDSTARKDWGWKHAYGLRNMTSKMISQLSSVDVVSM